MDQSGSEPRDEEPSELPPTRVFELDWASPAERADILRQMPGLKRQTMNLRVMPQARLLRIRAPEDNDRLVGWAGVDTEFNPDLGEVFSLYVVPAYRTYLVGVILETARAAYLTSRGVSRVLVRMESATNTSLLRYRVRAGLVREISPDEVPPAALELCTRCELYQNQCTSQAYFWVDAQAFLARGLERLGRPIDIAALPLKLSLDPSKFRGARRPLHPDGPVLGVRAGSEHE